MPTTLTTILRNHDGAGTRQTCTKIRTESIAYVRTIPAIMNPPQTNDNIEEILARSNGVITRVRMVNATLRHLRIDCSELDNLAVTGTAQLAILQEMSRDENRSGISSTLTQFRDTVKSLRDAYRGVLVREDLPGEIAQGVLSVAQSLDITAVKAGIA